MSRECQLMARTRQGIRRGCSGFGLIEVSISLLVLSIGTLGLASLQISAGRLGHEAIQRTEAAALAMDIFERMRANRSAAPHYQAAALGAAGGGPLAAPGRDCNRDSCSALQLKDWDLWQWERALNGAAVAGSAGGLVRPTGCVTVRGRLVTVEIAWEGFRPLAASTGRSDCGVGRYGPGDAARQWLRMTSYISEARSGA